MGNINCIWIKEKECPYFENIEPPEWTNKALPHPEGKIFLVKKKEIAALDNFSESEICSFCLKATKIVINSRK